MVARHTGIGASTLCNLEGGKRVPSTLTAEILIESYRLSDADAALLRSVAVQGVGRDRRRQPRG
jgi:hypothetical protein